MTVMLSCQSQILPSPSPVKDSTQTFREICLPVQCGDDGASLEGMPSESISDTPQKKEKRLVTTGFLSLLIPLVILCFRRNEQ